MEELWFEAISYSVCADYMSLNIDGNEIEQNKTKKSNFIQFTDFIALINSLILIINAIMSKQYTVRYYAFRFHILSINQLRFGCEHL